jgi:AmmeMemoRadiSam system protein B/AmmeMemoRadiSam system protein A
VQAAAQTTKPRQPKILIAPHAGHIYSGMTAGAAYARLLPFAQTIRRVILLGPAHRVYFQGVALPGVGAFATPLGAMPIDTLAADALADLPWVSTRADAHAQEHSLEVHVPFLQRVLPQAQLLPLLVGDASPEQVAQTIERLWGGDETLMVISTDLSHFHGYDAAQAIDTASCAQVLALDATLTHAQACGATPVNAALQVAKARGMQITQLAQCNSGDTAGDKERVVGYASFALYAPLNTTKTASHDLSAEQGAALVQIARAALHEATGAAKEPVPGGRNFTALGASFVTLTQGGQLRGCIGSLQAQRPLADDVRANAQAAALHDSRFAPVTAAEAAGLKVEVSVLTPPEPLQCANESHAIWQLRTGVDGIVLECEHAGRSYRSTYLPQVWEQIPEPRAFMAHLKVKAGLPFDFWSPQMRLSRYRVQKFCE